MARAGRRPGQSGSRATIIDAAMKGFAERGYDGTSIRSIAADAKVDPALVMHFFSSKDRLFVEAMQWPFDPEKTIAYILDGSVRQVGERLAREFVTAWDQAEGRKTVLGLMGSAVSNVQAERLLRDFIAHELLGPLAEQLNRPDAELRAALVGSQLIGMAFARYVLRVPPLDSLDAEGVVALIAPTIQRYLTGRIEVDLAVSEHAA